MNQEAIAGKCNVVCISKDSRNPQPTDEELQMADYVFRRTFDVGTCKIMDKMDDEIAGIDVKLLINKMDAKKEDPESKKKLRSLNEVRKFIEENSYQRRASNNGESSSQVSLQINLDISL